MLTSLEVLTSYILISPKASIQ